MSKKTKIISLITAISMAVIIIFSCVFGCVIYPRYLQPQPVGEDWALSAKARKALMGNFTDNYDVAPGKKAPLKRKIDAENPLHLANCYDAEALMLWNSVPDNQKPYTVIILIYGSALLPQSPENLRKLEASAELCEANQIPYCIQVISGETPMESRYPVGWLEERFASQHEYFYGINCAELYNGVLWRGELESNQSLYLIELINMVSKYGAFFFWTDANMRYEDGAIITWLQTNESLYTCFKENSQNIVMMNKESSSTMQKGMGNPTSYAIMQGLWLSGLIGAWGSKSDWWHWEYFGFKGLFGQENQYLDDGWDVILNYPESMFLQAMTMLISRGGTCFSQEAPAYSMSSLGQRVAGYQYGIIPLIDHILNGDIVIPDRETVLADTTAVVLGYDNYISFQYDMKKSNQYPQTGRYNGILPLLPTNLRRAERAVFEQKGIQLIDSKKSKKFYDSLFPAIDADTYITRTGKQWFYLVSDENVQVTRYASFAPMENSAANVRIQTTEHTAAIMKESSNKLSFWVNNYRTDKTNMIKEIDLEMRENLDYPEIYVNYLTLDENGNPKGIDDSLKRLSTFVVKGTLGGGRPSVEYLTPQSGDEFSRSYTVTEEWNAATQELTIKLLHNGEVRFNVNTDDSGKTWTAPVKSAISETLKQTNIDKTNLQNALDSCKIGESKDYLYYSYLQYHAAYGKVQKLIKENSCTKTEANKAIKELNKAKDNLVSVKEAVELLTSVYNLDQTLYHMPSYEAAMTSADSLLREILAQQIYVPGRNGSLDQVNFGYVYSYASKPLNSKNKRQVIQTKINDLKSSVERLMIIGEKK